MGDGRGIRRLGMADFIGVGDKMLMNIIIACGIILLASLLFRIKIIAVIIWMAGIIAAIVVQHKFQDLKLFFIVLGASILLGLYLLFWKGLDRWGGK